MRLHTFIIWTLTLSQSIAQETLEPYIVEGIPPGDGVPSLGFHTDTFTRTDLEQLPGSTLSDQLAGKGGLRLFRRQSALTAHPTTQGAALRVAGPNGASRANVYLDGVPLNDAFGGWIPWTAINTFALSSTQIVQPSGVDPWGNASLGGSLWLQSDLEDPYWRFEGSGGTALDHRLSNAFMLSPNDGRTRIFGSWSSLQSDGYHVIKASQRGPIDEHATVASDTASLGLAQALGGDWELSGEVRYHEEDRGNGTPQARNAQKAWQSRLSLGKERGADNWEGRFNAFWQTRDFSSTFTRVTAERDSERPVLDQFDVPSSSLGLNWRSRHWLGNDHEFLLGADGRMLEGQTNERFRNLGPGFTRLRQAGGERLVAGASLAHRWQANSQLTLDSRVRIDRSWDRDGEEKTWDITNGELLTKTEHAPSEDWQINARIGLEWEPHDTHSFHVSTFTGTRRPTLNELYRPFRVGNDITLANAGLDSERLWGTALGWTWQPREAFTMRIEGFWQRLDDGIANITLTDGGGNVPPWGFIPEGGSGRQRRNLAEVTIKGLEADIHWQSDEGWHLEAGYLLTDSQIRSSPDQPDLEGNTLSQTPTHQAYAAIGYDQGDRFYTRVQARWTDKVFDDDRNNRPLDDYVSINVQVGWRWTAEVTTFLAIENLLDEEVEVSRTGNGLVGIGAPRLIHLGLRLDF
ncbi:TonB-dependent receptor [bacterium]|nr:TonB-dependent receptor [bacterium]